MLLFTLILSVILGAAEIDIIIPSFPELQSTFNLSAFKVELILTINLIAHCIAALFAGTLGDKYGKKRLIIYGLLVFIVGIFLSATANTFEVIILGRILQGIGVAPGLVLSYVIAAEKSKNSGRAMALLNAMYGIALSVAPVIGSYTSLLFGWRGNFWVLGVIAVIVLIFSLIFIENDSKNNKDAKINLTEYAKVLKNKTVMYYLLTLILITSSFYTFVALAPLFYIKQLGVSLERFGIYQGIPALSFAIFNIFNVYLIKVIGKKGNAYFTAILIGIFLVLNAVMLLGYAVNPITAMAAMIALSIATIVPFNTIMPLAFSTMPEGSSKISGLFSTLRWVFASIAIQTASHYYNDTYTAIGVVSTICVLIAITFFVLSWNINQNLKKGIMND